MSEPKHDLLEIHAPRGARVLHAVFADGHRGEYPHELLRGYCPCAQCQGHTGPVRFVEGADFELREIEEVGNYGLQLTWGDGHATGIYAFRFLRALCMCPECASGDLKARQFSR
jgi:DUF971 family protein